MENMKNRSSSSYEQISPPPAPRPEVVANFEEKSHLSPLDYVKNRIVEVMRISEEEEDATDSKAKEAAPAPEQRPEEAFGGGEERSVESGYPSYPPPLEAAAPQVPAKAEAQYEPLSDPED